MAKQTCIDAVTAELDAAGIAYTTERGAHIKVRFSCNGQNRTYVCPNTHSDHRSILNCRTGIRRILRELGVLF